MDKYFGMNKVSVRQKTKPEQTARIAAMRNAKEVWYFISGILVAAIFAACIFFEEKNNAVLSELIRIFVFRNK